MSGLHVLLFVTCALSIVMLLVLYAPLRGDSAGVREWFAANACAAVALPLFALRDIAPGILSVEIANLLLLIASALMLAGYRRHFCRRVPTRALAAATVATMALLSLFHYVFDSVALRIVAVSAFHGAVCAGIGWTVMRAPKAPRSRYPYRFAAGAAFLLALGHGVRLVVYLLQANSGMTLFDESSWNVAFLALGTLALPTMTIGAVLITYDALVSRAEDMANRDFLTGAWSRRAFFELAEQERMRALRKEQPLSLVLFDVDYFKAINDSYGHDSGDRVLVDIVLQVESLIRSIDYCARLGGEEFVVLLPDTDRAAALVVAERMRLSIMRMSSLQAQGEAVRCTISAGVATLQDAEETVAELLRRADRALYAAKAMGRNAVSAAEDIGIEAGTRRD